ncbi:membrane protein [Acrocarpospora phusangensis]|uniref:Membrane protein n=1 Tax=Acrocarpospora phusangensis TaxID=1070424 RepID=A0A919ULS9_9ACTN|nr:DMT family transporter [Acrocarpospora phusangensis]GIH26284.1 membrane protein [Acrocarpospora phusangensis]
MSSVRSLPVGRGMLFIAVAATMWGTGGAVAALLYPSGLGALAVSFWRFLGGAAVLGLAWPLLRFPLLDRFRAGPVRMLAAGAGMAVYQTAYLAAIDVAGVAVATVVTLGSGPILVAAGARLWLGERLGGRGAVLVASALAGLTLLVTGGGTAAEVPVLGVGLALLSAVGYAGTILLGRSGEDSMAGTLVGFAAGALCLLPFAALSGLFPDGGVTVTVVGLLAYLGVFPSALAYGLFFAGLRVVPAATASVVALVEALVAAAVAVAFLGERLTVPAVAGGVLLLGAVVLIRGE